ncbi:hypothetical protein PO124_01100 [Bacillus licheniformis]|nr:hypothetical protein [Bacillus licheniformis]
MPEGQVIKQSRRRGISQAGRQSRGHVSLGPKQSPSNGDREIDIPYEPGAAGEEQTSKFRSMMKNTAFLTSTKFQITAPAERTIKFRIAPGQKGIIK